MMFEQLTRYPRIVVSGPQRSGTTIASLMIAADTGYMFVPEESFRVFDVNRFRQLLRGERVVVQCPALCYCVDQFGSDDVLIVMMKRDLDDIRASEERIGWGQWAEGELLRYGMEPERARTFWQDGGSVAAVKYRHWRERQRENVMHWIELEYEALAAHLLWLPPEKRVDFAARQVGARS